MEKEIRKSVGKIPKYRRRDTFVDGEREKWKMLNAKSYKEHFNLGVMESEIEKKKTWAEFHESSKSKDYYSIE